MSQNNYQSYDQDNYIGLMNLCEYPISPSGCSYCGYVSDDQTYVLIYQDNMTHEPQRICMHPDCLTTANHMVMTYSRGNGTNDRCTVCNTINTSCAISILNCVDSQYPFCLNNTTCHALVIEIKNKIINPMYVDKLDEN